ncbi:MAG: hypothetical protein HOP14_03415 [Acidobacteria bacterium]|nr:hypothetical protein [Acidobacteriota bacterium]
MSAAPLARRLLPRSARVRASTWLAYLRAAGMTRRLSGLVRGERVIVAGPWLGEVGFELLYWIPFLSWFAERFAVPPPRLLVVSRGGTASWYQPVAGRYADVFDQVSPDVFRREHDARVAGNGEQKQTRITGFERALVDEAARRAGLDAWTWLHPSEMYALFNPFWWGHLPTSWVVRHARFRRFGVPDEAGVPGAPALPVVPPLPEPYVAVKFYFNECFPAMPGNRQFASGVINGLAERVPVVVLATGLDIDDHAAHTVDARGVRCLPEGLTPSTNLHVQSAVVARAQAFVGTYGGFSYLAPFYGVPSTAVYADESGFSPRHLLMARTIFQHIGTGDALRPCAVAQSDPAALVEEVTRG